MKKNKKLIVSVILMAVVFLIPLGIRSTFASLTDNDSAQNDFKVGGYKGVINENFQEPTKSNPAKLDISYTKEPKITNQEDVRMFVRVMILPKAISEEGILLPAEIDKDIILDINSEWIDGEDGYYYYKKILEPDKTSESLFSSVIFKNSDYEKANVTIELKLETTAAYSDSHKVAFWDGEPDTTTLKSINQIYVDAL